MTRKKLFFPESRILSGALGILFAFSLLTACESTKATSSDTKAAPSDEEYRDQVAAYCKEKAQKERRLFVKLEKAERKPERDLGVRARTVFNRAYELCLDSYGMPKSG